MKIENIAVKALVVLTAIFLLSSSTAWAEPLRGDTNCDGIVSTPDLDIFEEEYYKLTYGDPSTQCQSCGDFGMIECGETCVDNSTDEGNCGSCGNSCQYGEICYNGNCYVICEGCGCPPGLIDCGGTCVDNSTDEDNCGTCGNTCESDEICDNGTCVSTPPAPVAKTGQTTCYADNGTIIDCAGTGQDGDHQAGVEWPNPRFTDNGDGTVTDNLTGLIWLKNANCFGTRTWGNALSDCNNLDNGTCELTDGSQAGDWRLPNVKELQSLIDYEYYNPALPNTDATDKWTQGEPFTNVQSNYYWSGTSYAYNPTSAWNVSMYIGSVNLNSKTYYSYVWPVRSDN